MSEANRIAAMQSILQYKFCPGFDKLEEELRKFDCLVKTYHAVFGEVISDSITQAVIRSQMLEEIRTHFELQAFTRTTELISLTSSLSKIRTATTSPKAAALGPVPMESGWVKNKDKGKNKEKGKEKARAKGRAMRNPRTRSSKGGVATAESGVTTLPIFGTEKRNRSTKSKAKLARQVQAVRRLH